MPPLTSGLLSNVWMWDLHHLHFLPLARLWSFFFFSGAILRMQLSGLLTGNQVTGSPPSQALWGIYCGQKITFNTCEEHLFWERLKADERSFRIDKIVSLYLFLWRSPGEGNCNPLQYSCLENSMDRGAYSPWGHKESDMTGPHTHTHMHTHT